jgi:hypothetical protein
VLATLLGALFRRVDASLTLLLLQGSTVCRERLLSFSFSEAWHHRTPPLQANPEIQLAPPRPPEMALLDVQSAVVLCFLQASEDGFARLPLLQRCASAGTIVWDGGQAC